MGEVAFNAIMREDGQFFCFIFIHHALSFSLSELEVVMRLKKLEILGFKSFADKTKLEFHAGITAVVGPNGCGKSNIADAFRWVLGEQSAKSMRGGKMPDVIFAGTTHRKPLNFAEVTICLDDIEGKLPIEYEEVSITRRLHRSGESEYFINRHPVRLKDVQGLLLDSGMGKDAYSIFEQGKIDQVINLSALERRYIFEEAAGILRFLQRKKEALRKLEQTDGNVSRIKDIHQEVEKQIIVLEQQAEKARRYKEDKAELDVLEKVVLLTKWEAIQKRLSDAGNKVKDVEDQVVNINAQIDVITSQIFEAKQTLAHAEKTLRVRSEEVYQARSAKEIKAKEKVGNQERLKELQSKEKRWQQELETMIEKRKQREVERRTLKKTQADLEKRVKEMEHLVQTQRERATVLDVELSKLRLQQQSRQQDLLKHVHTENQCESELKQVTLRLENTQERQHQIQERKERLGHSAKELAVQVDEKKTQLEESSKGIDAQKEVFASLEDTLQDLGREMDNSQGLLDKLLIEISDSKARQKALNRLRQDMEGFSTASKHLIQIAAEPTNPFYNKIKGLYEYIVPKKGAEAALANVLRFYSQTLVVENEEDFAQLMAYVKSKKLKDLSLLCLETVNKICPIPKGNVPNEYTPFVVDIIENELANHFLQGVFTAKGGEEAVKAVITGACLEVLTADGMMIDRRGVVFYASQGENNVFMREAELKALETKLFSMESEKVQLENILRTIQQKKNAIQTERVELDKTIRRGEMKLVEINFALQKLIVDLGRIREEEKVLQSELLTQAKVIEEYKVALEDLRLRFVQAKTKAQDAKTQSETLNEQLESNAIVLKQEMAKLQEQEANFQQLVEENRSKLHALNVLDIKDLEGEQQERRLEEEIEIGRHQLSQIQERDIEVEKLLSEFAQNLNDVAAACAELEQEVSVRKGAIEHLDAKINEKRQILKKSETDRNQIVVQTAQLESVLQSLENELQERHRLTVTKAKEECGPLQKSLDQVEKQLRALRQQIENAGDINMTSIEECDKHKERYQFLNQQIDDLNLSKQELVSIIAELDGESRKIFKATFDQICLNFKKNFKILFNGGEADLQFTETSDVLEAGIEIIAKPPGKQMRSISLLSGGEKCLTAMALLFAVFEVKPAPFCILDEIDAPLDDTNVERFVNIVKEFVDRCQFIIITHNKRTMAIADVIFGVSMEERGVSKLLSMDFSEEAKPEPMLV